MSLFFRRNLDWSTVFPGWARGSSFHRSSKAESLVPVYAAVSLIADMFAALPQHFFIEDEQGRRRASVPGWLVKPDPRVDVYAWRYQYVTSLKLRGNAYGLVLGSGKNVLGVRWLHPDSIRVDESDPSGPRYFVGGATQPLTLYSQGGQLIHVPEFVQPGSVLGLSPIQQFKQVWETARYSVDYGRDWFEKSAMPTSLLTAKVRLGEGDAATAKTLFRESVADGGPVTLDKDWDYKALSIAPNEAQFLETIRATASMIANIFRVPPEDVGGEAGNSRTYGNREADAERFNVRTMLPLITRYELAIGTLLTSGEYLKLNMDVLTRPNLLERSRANTENLRNGSITLAEVRANEDRHPLTDAEVEFWSDHYLTQKSHAESIAESVSESITKEAL